MILKLGKGTFDVRLSARLLAAWVTWKIWPSFPNLQRLSRAIARCQLRPQEPRS